MNEVSRGFNYVYIIHSERHPFRAAIGITGNLAHALAQHNGGEIRATARFRPWAIELAVAFRQSPKAEEFEQYLRTSAGRAFARRHF